jgi:DNA-damage-inducible protein D
MSTELSTLVSNLNSVKRTAINGAEYWMARDILRPLGYLTWESFAKVIERAKLACESAGTSPSNHFRDTTKKVEIGSGALSERADCYLSRYACYLVAMNGDTRKAEIGIAQTYFAVQTRRQELQDQSTSLEKRLELRQRVAVANIALGSAAKAAGVQRYGLFQDAGYRGLYGMGLGDIKKRKNIEGDLLDHAGRVELAANEFRITQTEQKIVNEHVQGEQNAVITHKTVAAEVRATIKKLGGTMPEDLSPEPSLKKLIQAKKTKQLPKAK